VLGMSALSNFTYPEMKSVVEAVQAAELRNQVKIILGSAPVNEQVREFSGADYVDKDAGVNLCKQIYA
jgi:methanogenic corrinoid protein MtbC1